MKKLLLLVLLIVGSLIAQSEQSNIRLIGGISYSNIAGNDFKNAYGSPPDNLLGYKFGIESEPSSDLIIGISYTDRGFSINESLNEASIELNWKVSYLTGYLIKSIPMQSLDILIGAEIGYFRNAIVKIEACDGDNCEDDSENYDVKDWDNLDNNMFDFGPVIGFRYPVSETIFLNGTYYSGLVVWNSYQDTINRGFQFYLSFAL